MKKNNKNNRKKAKKELKNNNKKVIISFSEEMLTGNGGNVLMGRFMEGLGLEKMLEEGLSIERGKNITYSTTKMIMIFLKSIFIGAKRYSHIEMLKNDLVIREIEGYKRFPVITTITRFYHKVKNINSIELSNIEGELRKKVWDKRPLKEITLDIDSTVKGVYGYQEGAKKGYNPKNHGQKSYHPLLCYTSETRECLHSWLRRGDSYTGNGSVEFMKEALSKLPDTVEKITVRADSGFFDEKLLLMLEERGINYVIKVKLKNLREILIRQDWKEVDLPNTDESINKVYVTNLEYKCYGWNKSRHFVGIKLLKEVTQKENNKNKGKLESLLFELEKEEECEYYCFVTDIAKDEISIWELYKKRGECENLIENTKNQMYAGDYLLDNYWSNDFNFGLCVLAYNLFVWLMYLSMKTGWKIEPNTFRLMIIKVAGRLVKSRGKLNLRLQKGYYWKDIWIKIEEMIKDL